MPFKGSILVKLYEGGPQTWKRKKCPKEGPLNIKKTTATSVSVGDAILTIFGRFLCGVIRIFMGNCLSLPIYIMSYFSFVSTHKRLNFSKMVLNMPKNK